MKWLIVGPIVLIIGLVCGAYILFATAYVTAHLWTWHAVPLGAPALEWTRVAGLLLILRLVTYRPRTQPKDERDEETKIAEAAVVVAMPWVMLLFGWWLR